MKHWYTRAVSVLWLIGLAACHKEASDNAGFTPLLHPEGVLIHHNCGTRECWFKYMDVRKISSRNKSDRSFLLWLQEGSSVAPLHSDVSSSEVGNIPIHWNDRSTSAVIVCSHQNPRVDIEGQEESLPLASGDVPDILTRFANLYFDVCHSYFGSYVSGIGKYGYKEKK